MILVDLEDKVLAVNDSFCQMVGRNREEVIDNGAAPLLIPRSSTATCRPTRLPE